MEKSLPTFIVWIGYLELTTYCGTQVDASLSYEGEFCPLSLFRGQCQTTWGTK